MIMETFHSVWALHAGFPFGWSVSMLYRVDTKLHVNQAMAFNSSTISYFHTPNVKSLYIGFIFFVSLMLDRPHILGSAQCLTPMSPSSKLHIL